MERCTISTTGPNSLAEDLYIRMLVIVTPDNYDLWLDPDGTFSDGSFGS
jgi:putative SOS response-associated peptidase YedK